MENNQQMKEFNNAVAELKNNCIYAMSLGSKELFHSNFWAWLFEHNREYIKVFFDEIDGECVVKREDKHRDITISCKDKVYIIENKLKSNYDYGQLKNYKENEPKFAKGIYTGLAKSQDDIGEWKYKSYNEIADDFENVAINEKDNVLKEIIFKYIKSIRDLYNVISSFEELCQNQLPHWLDKKNEVEENQITKKLSNLRIWDLCQKRLANKFLNYMNNNAFKSLKTEFEKRNLNIELNTWMSFSNGTSIIDIRFERKDADKKNKQTRKMGIGIQIQDWQFRFCAEIGGALLKELKEKDNDNTNNKDYVFNKFKELGWFKSKGEQRVSEFKESRMKNDFCKYETRDYCFVYQYVNIDDFNFEKVNNVIYKEMLKALDIIEKLDFKEWLLD